MKEKIYSDIVIALKKNNKEVLTVLRMLKGAIQLEEINKKQSLSEEEVITVISKQIKSRKESIVQFELGNRIDLIEKTSKEIEILNKYMPKQLSEAEIMSLINEVFDDIKPNSAKDIGRIMNVIMPKIKGKADMSLVNKIIKEKL